MKRAAMYGMFLLMCGTHFIGASAVGAAENRNPIVDLQKRVEFDQQIQSADPEHADVGTPPHNHKQTVEDAVKDQLGNAIAIRFSDLTSPRKEFIYEQDKIIYGYSGCVNVSVSNGKDDFGPKRLFWVFYRNDKVLRVQDTEEFPYTRIFVGHEITCE